MSDPNEPTVSNGWEMGADESALLDAYESGDYSALDEAEAEEAAVDEEVVANAIEDLASEDLTESEEPVDEAEEDLDEGEEAGESEGSEDEEAADETQESVFYVDGPRGKKLEVPVNPDRDTLAKMAQAADRAKLFQSELDKNKHEMNTLKEEMESYKEESDLFRKLEELSDDIDLEDPSSLNNIIRAITNDKVDMDGLIDIAIAERDELIDLTDDQISVIEKTKELKRREREIKKAELRNQRDKERAEADNQRKSERSQRDMINNALLKHDVRGTLGDQSRENGIMERAWHESLRKMTALDEHGNKVYDNLTPELVEEIIKSEIEFFAGPSKIEVDKKVDKVIKRKRAASTKKVQNAIAPKKGANSNNKLKNVGDLDFNEIAENFDNIDQDWSTF
jgi:hypothetical protein